MVVYDDADDDDDDDDDPDALATLCGNPARISQGHALDQAEHISGLQEPPNFLSTHCKFVLPTTMPSGLFNLHPRQHATTTSTDCGYHYCYYCYC